MTSSRKTISVYMANKVAALVTRLLNARSEAELIKRCSELSRISTIETFSNFKKKSNYSANASKTTKNAD